MKKPFLLLCLTFSLVTSNAHSSVQEALKDAVKQGTEFSQSLELKCRIGTSTETEMTQLAVNYRPLTNKDIYYVKSANHEAVSIKLSADNILGQVSFSLRPSSSAQRNFIFQLSNAERDLNLSYLVDAESFKVIARNEESPFYYYGSGLKTQQNDCHVSAGFEEGSARNPIMTFENTIDAKYAASCTQDSGKEMGTPRRGAIWSTLMPENTNEISFHADMWGFDYADYSCEM